MRRLLLCAAAAGALAAAQAQAGGFQLREGSAAAQGASLAGRTSGDRDVSFALHNPAALRTVERFEMSAGVAGVLIDSEARANNGSGPFSPIELDDADDPEAQALVPSFAAGWRLNDTVVFGLAVEAPFGLALKYDDDFVGAFQGVESELTNVVIAPLVSVEPVDGFAFALGPTLSYAKATLSQRTGNADLGVSKVEGDDFSVGFTMGALADLGPRTTVGIAFQSGVDHALEGDFEDDFTVPGIGDVDGSGTAEISLPAVASIGVTHGFTDDFRMMAEAEFTGWRAFDTIDFTSDERNASFSDLQDYNNSFMLALGGEYDVSDRFTIRSGVAYDRSPVSENNRSVRVPDGDRYWLSLGFSYEITESLGVDAAYTFIQFEKESVELDPVGGGAIVPAGTSIDYESQAHVVGLNLRYRF